MEALPRFQWAFVFLALIASILACPFGSCFLNGDINSDDAVLVLAGATDLRHELGAELVATGNSMYFGVFEPLGESDIAGFALC